MAHTTFSSSALFAWYDRHARDLPWRHRWPNLAPAYHVWLSEIMLQQTIVATVIPYFLDFTRRWPQIENLAAAPLDDVLAAWAGLGYYARARNLHKAAWQIANDHAGQFPQTYAGLLALPGVGPYTAGAISAIAFGQNQVVVDGNIERVLTRYFGIKTPLPAAKAQIGAYYAAIMPEQRPSDFPQALMDFANAACTVKNPICMTSLDACPFASGCVAGRAGEAERYPVKAPKKPKPERRGIAFVAQLPSGEALLIRRDDKGLLGGMLGFPSHGWASKDQVYSPSNPFEHAPFLADWRLLDAPVQHVFTHFALQMDVAIARIASPIDTGLAQQKWQSVRTADLPTLMRKVWKLAKDAR